MAAKGKPKCTQGTACGYSCISKAYICSGKIIKRDADALLELTNVKANSGNAAIDSQKPPLDFSTPAAIESYVRAWQKDRGFESEGSTTLDVHDIDHAIAYKSSGLSPKDISDKFGSPDRVYNGTPTFAEEAFVLMHAVSALPGVSKEQTLEYIQQHYSTAVRKGVTGSDAFPAGKPERAHYADEAAMKTRFEEMYKYIEAASPEDRDLSKRNAVRYMAASTSALTKQLKIDSVDEDIIVDKVFEFSESDLYSGFSTMGLALLLLSVDNCSGKGRKADFKSYLDEASVLFN